MSSIADIRKDYQLKSLSEHDVSPDPVKQFRLWWDEAIASKIEEVNAMTVATASADGTPYARILLLKGFSEKTKQVSSIIQNQLFYQTVRVYFE